MNANLLLERWRIGKRIESGGYLGYKFTVAESLQFALGYAGNGITFATIASAIIPDLISGTKNSDSSLFRFDRKSG